MKKQEILGLSDPAQCCGCGACAVACPVNAITMVAKDLGAYYPEVNMDRCVSCGKCQKVCVFQSEEERSDAPLRVYAAANADRQQLKGSASGGVFAALAKSVIAEGGIVYGCSMEYTHGVLTPMHIGIDTEAALTKLQGSKYVQSKAFHCFPEVKTHLQSGRVVFFSGTPCQVAALKCYLRETNTERLFAADLVCHGTPGTVLFEDYIARLKKRQNGDITAFSFRDKSSGWGLLASYQVQDKNGREKQTLLRPDCSSYYSLFLSSETYRESCYSCPWANTARVGDVTLGDYWGIENEHPEYLTENGGKLSAAAGISVLLVNSEQGKTLLKRFGSGLVLEASNLESASRQNTQLRKPSSHTALREELVRCYETEGYPGVEKLFRKKQGLRYCVRRIKNLFLNWKNKRRYE